MKQVQMAHALSPSSSCKIYRDTIQGVQVVHDGARQARRSGVRLVVPEIQLQRLEPDCTKNPCGRYLFDSPSLHVKALLEWHVDEYFFSLTGAGNTLVAGFILTPMTVGKQCPRRT